MPQLFVNNDQVSNTVCEIALHCQVGTSSGGYGQNDFCCGCKLSFRFAMRGGTRGEIGRSPNVNVVLTGQDSQKGGAQTYNK